MPQSAAVSMRAQHIAEEAERFYSQPESERPAIFVPRKPRASNAVEANNNLGFQYDSIEEAFPNVDPRMEPLGNLVLVMIRQPKYRTQGGLEIDAETRKLDHDNTQAAKVVAIGPLAFHNRNDGAMWPEGAWCKVGDYVRVPKYQGDRFAVRYERPDFEIDANGQRRETTVSDEVVFAQFKDLFLLGKYPTAEDALAAKAWL